MTALPILLSAGASAVSVGTAVATENKVIIITTIIINAAILISNAAIGIYRQWRDRDKDLVQKDDEPDDKE